MRDPDYISPEFSEWIVQSLDGAITAEDFARLEQELIHSNAARDYYLELIATSVGLVDLVGVLPKTIDVISEQKFFDGRKSKEQIGATYTNEPKSPLQFEPGLTEEEKKRKIQHYAKMQLEAYLEEQPDIGQQESSRTSSWDFEETIDRATTTLAVFVHAGIKFAKATAVTVIVAAMIMIVYLLVNTDSSVAVLLESVDAKWSIDIENGTQLTPGPLKLECGYAHIQLKKGTEVIVQAPSILQLQTSNKMFLERGLITASVPAEAKGFTVETPLSSVVDFGTEFGLLVGDKSNMEVHVFKGKVNLDSADKAGSVQQSQQLETGEAAAVDIAGRIEQYRLEDRPRLFVQTMPNNSSFAIPGKRLSLADIVGGGNGLNTGVLGQGIDPTTGNKLPIRTILDKAGNGFIPVPWSFLIDGVFVPNGTNGRPVITSTGIVFERCPNTNGQCHEGIINGAMFNQESLESHSGSVAARTYGTKDSPSIGMYPNAGITFDLGRIRSILPGVSIDRFCALCGISTTVLKYSKDSLYSSADASVSFWVLVDGQIRYSKQLTTVPCMSEWIDIELSPKDRFLTLVTTTPGEFSYCWSMFAEPALELNARQETAQALKVVNEVNSF